MGEVSPLAQEPSSAKADGPSTAAAPTTGEVQRLQQLFHTRPKELAHACSAPPSLATEKAKAGGVPPAALSQGVSPPPKRAKPQAPPNPALDAGETQAGASSEGKVPIDPSAEEERRRKEQAQAATAEATAAAATSLRRPASWHLLHQGWMHQRPGQAQRPLRIQGVLI